MSHLESYTLEDDCLLDLVTKEATWPENFACLTPRLTTSKREGAETRDWDVEDDPAVVTEDLERPEEEWDGPLEDLEDL